MFKGLREIFGRVQNTAIIDVGDVDIEQVVCQFGLRSLNGNPSLSCHTTDRHLGNTPEEGFTGCILLGRPECTCHDVGSRVGVVCSTTKVGWKFSTAEVGQDG
jgi:hypothetical protein